MSVGDGRTARGRFAAGNSGGPGRPHRAVEADYLRTLSERCPPEAWGRIVDSMVERATRGEVRAVEWLSRYLLGAPAADRLTELTARDEAGKDQLSQRVKALGLSPVDRALAELQGEM